MSRARARARLRRPTGLRRGSTAEQPREPAGSIARRPPSRRARTTVPSRAAHERWGAVPRESPLHSHFHQAEVCTGRAPQLHAVCLAHIRRCKRTAAERAARLVVELVGEPMLAQAAPARTRAHCRPTLLDRLHECKTLREVLPPPRSRAAAAAKRQYGRTCTPAQAPVPHDARPAQHVATQCNMLQHAAPQRNVCALHQRRSRCRRMRGLCGAFDMARPRHTACANPTDSAAVAHPMYTPRHRRYTVARM